MSIFPMNCSENIILMTDSYKVSHHCQYPEKTTLVFSYFESRGGKFPHTVFFGLQYILKRYLCGQVVTQEKVLEAKELYSKHFSLSVFNEEGWNYILEKHGGHIPLRIKAVPEGTVVPVKNVLFVVENTDPECFWLTNYFETLLVQVWYPMTVATNSRCLKELIAKYLDETADDLLSLPFKLHDFGFRGSTSVESAGIGGAGHLVNFMGTDNMAAVLTARNFYHCDMAGMSVPAAEHSTITTWGRDGEKLAFSNMLTKFSEGTVSVVSDSYDIYNACSTVWGEQLRGLVSQRNGVLVIRPDSGDPTVVVVKVLEILGRKFGTKTNGKGYRMLPDFLRIIQGDGIDHAMLGTVLETVRREGWSADNLVFGSGGALLQKMDRDSQKCAFKCSFAVVDGKQVNVFKQPITDPGKNSKKGRLTLECRCGVYTTVEEGNGDSAQDQLVLVFENGRLMKDYAFSEIRRRAEIDLVLRRQQQQQQIPSKP